jgi:hypothetical protein
MSAAPDDSVELNSTFDVGLSCLSFFGLPTGFECVGCVLCACGVGAKVVWVCVSVDDVGL